MRAISRRSRAASDSRGSTVFEDDDLPKCQNPFDFFASAAGFGSAALGSVWCLLTALIGASLAGVLETGMRLAEAGV